MKQYNKYYFSCMCRRTKTNIMNRILTARRGALSSVSDSWSVDTCQSWVRAPSKAPVHSLSKKLNSNCLVLVGSKNGFERDLHKQTFYWMIKFWNPKTIKSPGNTFYQVLSNQVPKHDLFQFQLVFGYSTDIITNE